MNLVFLSNEFYNDFNGYAEILQKEKRPYVMFLVCYNNLDFAIPFRSNVKHSFCYKTSKTIDTAIDFTKSVIIIDHKYVYRDEKNPPKLRDDEFKEIKGKDYQIKTKFIKYITDYIKSFDKLKSDKAHYRDYQLCKFSTLQNYHNHLGISNDFNITISNFETKNNF